IAIKNLFYVAYFYLRVSFLTSPTDLFVRDLVFSNFVYNKSLKPEFVLIAVRMVIAYIIEKQDNRTNSHINNATVHQMPSFRLLLLLSTYINTLRMKYT